MVKFLKPNKTVIVLHGLYTGPKAVVVDSSDEVRIRTKLNLQPNPVAVA